MTIADARTARTSARPARLPVPARTRAARAVAVTSLGALALVACGQEEATQSPGQRVQAAAEALGASQAVTARVSLDLDEASRTALADLAAQQSGGEAMPPDMVERLVGSSVEVVVTTTDGSALDEVDTSAAQDPAVAGLMSTSVLVDIGDVDLLEVRSVDGQAFVRTDLDGFGQLVGEPDLAAGLEESATGTGGTLGAAMSALAAGDWASADLAELEALAGEAAAAGAGMQSSPEQEELMALLQDVADDVAAVLRRELVVEETGEDAYTVTAPLGRLVDGLAPTVRPVVEQMIGAVDDAEYAEGTAEVRDSVADRQVVTEITVEDDVLASVRLDLAQVVPDEVAAQLDAAGVTGVPLLVELEDEGSVEAPADAVAVDPQELAVLASSAAAGEVG